MLLIVNSWSAWLVSGASCSEARAAQPKNRWQWEAAGFGEAFFFWFWHLVTFSIFVFFFGGVFGFGKIFASGNFGLLEVVGSFDQPFFGRVTSGLTKARETVFFPSQLCPN